MSQPCANMASQLYSYQCPLVYYTLDWLLFVWLGSIQHTNHSICSHICAFLVCTHTMECKTLLTDHCTHRTSYMQPSYGYIATAIDSITYPQVILSMLLLINNLYCYDFIILRVIKSYNFNTAIYGYSLIAHHSYSYQSSYYIQLCILHNY